MYAFRSTHGLVELAFTDRLGGVSAAPYDELNLALVSGDDPAAVAENLRRVLADFAPDAEPAPTMVQVHGPDVAYVEHRDRLYGDPMECDGQVTDERDLVLLVRVADCVPVLLADADAGIVGVAHAGRRGLATGVVPRTVERMRDRGASAVTAWIGPHICGACYEVPESMREDVAAIEPAARGTTSWGMPALDIGAGVRAQLERDGVTVVDVSRCTRESEDLYSYRRDGDRAGRLAGLIALRGGRG